MINIVKILFLINIVVLMADWGYLEKYDMIIGNPKNHHDIIENFDKVIFYYHTRTCKYCKKSDRFMHDLALKFKEGDNKIPIVNVNCDNFIHLCEEENIIYYPYIKAFIKGHFRRFKEVINKKNVFNFINNILNTKPKELNFGESQKIINENNNIVTFYYTQSITTNRFKIFDLLSKYEENIKFYFIKDEQFVNKYNLNNGDIITFNLKNQVFIYKKTQINNFDNIEEYYYKITKPLFIEFKNNSMENILETYKRHYFLFSGSEQSIEEFTKFADKNKHLFKFIIIEKNVNNEEGVRKLKELLLISDNNEQIVVLQPSIDENHLKYRFNNNISLTNLELFNEELNKNLIKNYFKNQQISDYFYKDFKILNRENYNKNIFIKNQDKVVLIYKNLKNNEANRMFKIIQNLKNKKFKKDKTLKFYLFDISKNEYEHIHILNFPAVFIYSRVNFNFPLIVGEGIKEKELYYKIKERHFRVANIKRLKIEDL